MAVFPEYRMRRIIVFIFSTIVKVRPLLRRGKYDLFSLEYLHTSASTYVHYTTQDTHYIGSAGFVSSSQAYF